MVAVLALKDGPLRLAHTLHLHLRRTLVHTLHEGRLHPVHSNILNLLTPHLRLRLTHL